MPNVTFLPRLVSVEAEEGEVLLAVAERAGVLIDASCNGCGTCGVCKVRVECETPAAFDEHEIERLSESERSSGYRLACRVPVSGDCLVTVPSAHGGSDRKKKMVKLPDGFHAGERVVCWDVKVPKAKMDYQVNDVDRLRGALGMQGLHVPVGLLDLLHGQLSAKRGQVSVALDGDDLVYVKAGEGAGCYGAAFDIGTTTVVGMLWNLNTAELAGVATRTNYQSLHGADVISRIAFCMAESENLSVLQSKVMACCNDIVEELCEVAGIEADCIVDAVLDGNTTMAHLALGVSPESMSRTPFAPVFREAQDVRAESIGLAICPNAKVHFLPIIAGHVGSDIVGMMLAADLEKISGCHVAIDIGTNGEVVAIRDGRMLCCSTAAGPAFEGATIGCGMRAAPGAIEEVVFSEDGVRIATIDGEDPVGICGSGLIDAVAQLLEWNIVDESGKMRSRAECEAEGVPPALSRQVIGEGLDARFVLSQHEGLEDIVLSQGDIREVQLAKGAILAGIQTLMKELGMSVGDIDSVMLAGAFGNYIKRESALRIGLLPQVDIDRVRPIGNAAGVGCCMALLSHGERERAEKIARATGHIELSRNEDFQDFYITAMTFAR